VVTPLGTRLRAMVVDDSPIALQTLCSYVAQNVDVEVIARAEDGCSAVELVETVRPDVVIMDIQMPRMNGLEAARRITEKFPDIKIVLVTLHDTPEIRAAARECGARWFVPKGRLTKELTSVIAEVALAVFGRSSTGNV